MYIYMRLCFIATMELYNVELALGTIKKREGDSGTPGYKI